MNNVYFRATQIGPTNDIVLPDYPSPGANSHFAWMPAYGCFWQVNPIGGRNSAVGIKAAVEACAATWGVSPSGSTQPFVACCYTGGKAGSWAWSECPMLVGTYTGVGNPSLTVAVTQPAPVCPLDQIDPLTNYYQYLFSDQACTQEYQDIQFATNMVDVLLITGNNPPGGFTSGGCSQQIVGWIPRCIRAHRGSTWALILESAAPQRSWAWRAWPRAVR